MTKRIKIVRKRNLHCIAGCFILLFLSVFSWANVAKKKRPNILWITTEDMSPHLGCYGDSLVSTPVIDQLASKGVCYNNAYASAPVCAPARSSIITGMHQSSIGSHHMRSNGRFPEGLKYFPQLLREEGYYCTNNFKEDYNLHYNTSDIWDESGVNAHWRNRNNSEQPFFAVFNFLGTHESATNSKEKHLRFTKDLPKNVLLKPGDVPVPPYFPNTPLVKELMTRYYNNIAALDVYVGDILKELEEAGLEDNTIIIFYSDHGAGLPVHKRWLYDSGLKVPFIVRMPEKFNKLIPYGKGTTTNELVSFVDLAPTALNLAEIPVPKNMQGRAFLGEILTKKREYIYASRDRMDERYDMQRAVRDKRYKYIRYYEPSKPFIQYMNTPEKGAIMMEIRSSHKAGNLPRAGVKLMAQKKPLEELFDLKDDPLELNNLAENPNYNEILKKMRQAHTDWSVKVADGGLIPEAILREWEQRYNKSIYTILREKNIPVEKIQKVALATDLELFMNNLQDANEVVRYWAATGIGNYADVANRTMHKKLKFLLDDECSSVRIAAARALCMLNFEREGIPILVGELKNKDEWTRLNAALVLDEIGEKAKPFISDLKMALEDNNKYVVRVVNRTLNVLHGTNNVVR